MKNFLLKYDPSRYFSGSSAVWNIRGGATISRLPLPRRAKRGEGKNSFELYSIYTASQDFSSG
jgi:hypothetical protein